MVGANRRGKPVFPLLEPPAKSRGAAPHTARKSGRNAGNLGGTAESLPSQNNRDGKAFFLSLRDKAPGALTAMEEEIMLDISDMDTALAEARKSAEAAIRK